MPPLHATAVVVEVDVPKPDVQVAPVREEEPIPAEVVADILVALAPNGATPEVVLGDGVSEVQRCKHVWILKSIEGRLGWVHAKCDLCPAEKSYRVGFASYSGWWEKTSSEGDEPVSVEVETEELVEEEIGEVGEIASDQEESDPINPDAVSSEITNHNNGLHAGPLFQDDLIATIIAEEKARANTPLVREQSPPLVVVTQEMLKALMEEESHEF